MYSSLGLAYDLDLRVGDAVTVQVAAHFLRPPKSLFSRILEGRVLGLTRDRMRLQGMASTGAASHCGRCGKEITHPASLLVGYGPTCCNHLGIAWVLTATDEDVAAARSTIQQRTQIDDWFPRSSTRVLLWESGKQASADDRLFDLVAIKTGLVEDDPAFREALNKVFAYVAKTFGDRWSALDDGQQEVVLQHLRECPPAGKSADVRVWVAGGEILTQSEYSVENAHISRSASPWGRWRPDPVKAWAYPAQSIVAVQIQESWAKAGKSVEGDAEFTALVEAGKKLREVMNTKEIL